ncbi:MAG: TolC family protein [Bacteroidales bacterium]|nr:TolC family protein [Bacteroidales bacterium]
MKTKRITVLLFSICLAVTGLQAETYTLTLEQSIQLAKEQSLDMLSLKQDLRIAEFNLKSTTSRFKTNVSMSLTAPEYTETIRQFEDSTGITFYSVQQLNYGSSLTIRQPLPTDGNISIRSSVFNTEDFLYDNRLTNINTRLSLVQPINALYGYNNILSAFKEAKLNYERTQKSLRREELNLEYNVSNAFYSLLSVQKREEIARLNLERQTEAFQIAKNKYEAGLIREVDALQMEVDLAEAQNNYDLSLIDQSSALNNFKNMLGIELEDSIVISSNMEYEIVLVSAEQAVQSALENRLEIREQEIQLEMDRMNIKRQKSEGMITGNLTAYYERSGVSKLENTSGLETSFNESVADFKVRPENYGLGFTINIPLIDWGQNRALVRAAEARMEKNRIRQEEIRRNIQREVIDLTNDVSSSLKRLQLLEKNVSVAEKSFEITRSRFSDGDIDSQALALERDRLNNAYLSHLSAYINYQLKLSDLLRKTFYDFKNDRPLL